MPYKFGQPWTPVYQDSPVLRSAATSNGGMFAAPVKNALLSAPKRTAGETVHDKIRNALAPTFGKIMAEKVAGAVDYSPASVLTDAFQLGKDAREKNYAGIAANALSTALNFVPDAKVAGAVAHSIIAPLFHGSPHKFEKFALEKIGTGEGAQAYGHGLYFAEQPEVARQYQKVLGYKHTGNAPKVDWNDPASAAGYWVNWHGGDVSKARDEVERMYASNLRAQPKGDHSVTRGALDILRSGEGYHAPPNPGHLYQVKLDANPEDFLDWDTPIGQHHPHVKDMLADIYGAQSTGASAYKMAADDARTVAIERGRNALTTAPAIQQQASESLLGMGIPGIRYLDQGSRGAGNGTRNYVVFDPSIIDILNRR